MPCFQLPHWRYLHGVKQATILRNDFFAEIRGMKTIFYISLLTVCGVHAQDAPVNPCICTAYGIEDVYINSDGNIEVHDFSAKYKIFSAPTGAFLGRANKSFGNVSHQAKESTTYTLLEKKEKKGTLFTASTNQLQGTELVTTHKKELFAKGDAFDRFEYHNQPAGISFVKTKDKFFFLSPYRIDTLQSGKGETAAFFKNIGEGFHPADIKPSSYALYKEGVGAVLTKTGVLVTAKDGIVGYNYPPPRLDGSYQNKHYKFWTDKPYLTYPSHNDIVTINYETGEIVRIVTIPKEAIRTFEKLQNSSPTFRIIDDRQVIIFAKQYSPNSYVWHYNSGVITPLCDAAAKEDYANAKKSSDAFYEWERKDRIAQQEAKQLADAKWYRENAVTIQPCSACGGKGGTSVENVTSASGEGYRTVYKTDGFGNRSYVTSNYGKSFYPCKKCSGTGQIRTKGQ